MTYQDLPTARASLAEFTPALRDRHTLVILPTGRVCRVLGTPADTDLVTVSPVRGNVWRAVWTSWGRALAEAGQ